MCDKNENIESCECLHHILETIVKLQRHDHKKCSSTGCDKPYLGPEQNFICYNTRPISLFNCFTGSMWSFPYTVNGSTGTSTVFRVESLDDCCCTCRVLYPTVENGVTTYNATSDFFTINLECVSEIKCYADTFIDLC